MGIPARHYCTAAEVLAMPEDGNRYEVVHGELLASPGPRLVHQRVVTRLVQIVTTYLNRFPSEGGAVLWDEVSSLLLVAEVLSPATADHDRITRRRHYQEVKVPLYWMVDADTQSVEVWTPEAHFPVVEDQEITWHPAGASEPLVIRLTELFRAP